MKTFLHSLLALMVLTIVSCATGKNALEKGNYETALDRAINRLQSNPDNKKSQDVLIEGYRLASNYHMDYIRMLAVSNDPNKWEATYYQYKQLNSYYRQIQRCPACLSLVMPKSYISEESDAARKAAEYQIELGNNALATNTIEGGRRAFKHFNFALNFDRNVPNIDSLLTDARNMGTVRVLIEPIPIHSRSLELTNEYFENRVIEYLDRFSQGRFVQFFTVDEAEQIDLQPDQIVSMQFDDFVLGQTLIESKTKEVKRDSVVVGQFTDDKGVKHDVYNTVKAELTINRKTLSSQGVMNFEIRDAYTNRILTNRKLPSKDVWVHEWASFNGDSRALTRDEIEMSKLKELPPPPPQTLFIGFVDRIYDQIIGSISNFYRDSEI
ncbi:hypothetical protein EV198_1643 [Roseivirga ehrenbergii]|uniref:Uncharacterized protein n=1 Tax=Roseivirga ehrenbergii (strain DSM 102268 / JCM 13514 / KCTC 12282 / NCIMB 14502 / KMM 6017) TaxID=279360 RepID=A0A150XS87_ROSEK|nr:hypothetical protein [Roseivirga ehrenbergii]KYG81462.1 hypothetical protein MB14_12770 [Roseivirga ehrenbergii]TCL10612.1 hypothetical protein EV198_1643 [Roseivirga ehrenbergii]